MRANVVVDVNSDGDVADRRRRRQRPRPRLLLPSLVLAACGGSSAAHRPSPEPAAPAQAKPSGEAPAPSEPDPPEKLEELRIAAIEKAMNQLTPAVGMCWGAGAADDFRLAGDVRTTIHFDDKTRPRAEITSNRTGDAVLADCLVRVLQAYPWPPVLAGEAIDLPFHFQAPRGQNLIDRRLVPRKSQLGAELGVLLDERNTGNGAASMIEVQLAAGASLPMAQASREEAWFFFHPVRLTGPDRKAVDLAGGDALYLRPGSFRAVSNPGSSPARFVIVAVPGGREGTARAGALPATTVSAPPRRDAPGPEVRRAADAAAFPRTGGATVIYFEAPPPPAKVKPGAPRPAPVPARAMSMSLLTIDAGVQVPAHRHPAETEMLYLLSGGGTMIVDGVELSVGENSAIQIPPAIEHSFAAREATIALQLYVPPGPEQRFKTMK